MTFKYLGTTRGDNHTKEHYTHGVYLVYNWETERFAAYQYGRPTTLLGRSDTREGALAIATREATIVRY